MSNCIKCSSGRCNFSPPWDTPPIPLGTLTEAEVIVCWSICFEYKQVNLCFRKWRRKTVSSRVSLSKVPEKSASFRKNWRRPSSVWDRARLLQRKWGVSKTWWYGLISKATVWRRVDHIRNFEVFYLVSQEEVWSGWGESFVSSTF